jgi:hypothetical protein
MPFRENLETPKHSARSKALVTVYGTYGGYDPSEGFPDLSGLVQIMNLTSITINSNRDAKERRELDASTLGSIIEMVPGLVDFENMEMNGIVTYKTSIIETCGFGGYDLRYQTHPMLLMLKLPSPNPSVVPERRLLLDKLWFKANPLEFSVEDPSDVRITQKIPFACAGVREVR